MGCGSSQYHRKLADKQQVILGLSGLDTVEHPLDMVRLAQQRLENNREKQGKGSDAHCLFRYKHTRINKLDSRRDVIYERI